MPDFRVCPACGEELEAKSEEKLYGDNRPQLTLDDAGELVKAEWGITEPDWESSTTTRYFCGVCGEDLPPEYQDALDAALDTRREPED